MKSHYILITILLFFFNNIVIWYQLNGQLVWPFWKTWKGIALSRDLLSRWGGPFNYGDYIVIEGTGDRDGVYQVRDTMNPKWTNRVDILTTNSRFRYDDVVMYKYINKSIMDNS